MLCQLQIKTSIFNLNSFFVKAVYFLSGRYRKSAYYNEFPQALPGDLQSYKSALSSSIINVASFIIPPTST
jgi:hypothetical protein